MIKEIQKGEINNILNQLPNDYKILDIGGASAPFKRVTDIIDIVPYSEINWSQIKGSGKQRFDDNSYTQFDICSRELWPFQNNQFDFSICSHVLEDIRDPIWVCSEIIRVSKAGYIEIPSRIYEETFGIEIRDMAGASHHRWIIDLFENKLRFTFKYMHIHTKTINKKRNKFNKEDSGMYLCLLWENDFDYYENWLNSGKKIFEFYLNKEITEKEKWSIYRKISSRNIVLRWIAYLKNINKSVEKIINKLK